jgi:fucose 4-O-acetylase-like acetyltransferase
MVAVGHQDPPPLAASTKESAQMDQSGRLHSFDNLRAIMMWLGIVLHVAINHTTGPSPLPFHDTQRSPLADLILVFIHAFRMPVFFILAGYFVALLAARRGYKGMLVHRLRRLALPFAIFWPVLIVCTTVLMLVYLHLMTYGTAGIELSLIAKKSKGASPFNTMHMWFIYYLIWFCVFTAVLVPVAVRAPARAQEAVDAVFRALASHSSLPSRWRSSAHPTVPACWRRTGRLCRT